MSHEYSFKLYKWDTLRGYESGIGLSNKPIFLSFTDEENEHGAEMALLEGTTVKVWKSKTPIFQPKAQFFPLHYAANMSNLAEKYFTEFTPPFSSQTE